MNRIIVNCRTRWCVYWVSILHWEFSKQKPSCKRRHKCSYLSYLYLLYSCAPSPLLHHTHTHTHTYRVSTTTQEVVLLFPVTTRNCGQQVSPDGPLRFSALSSSATAAAAAAVGAAVTWVATGQWSEVQLRTYSTVFMRKRIALLSPLKTIPS